MFQDYWHWPYFWKYVKEFVEFCDVCVRTKNPLPCLHGLLQLLSIHASLWYSISMGFITNLSPSNSYDSILVVVDYLMKIIHFIPCTKTIINKRTTMSFLDNVFQYHGLPNDIIFDCGLQFALNSKTTFWAFKYESEVVINFPSLDKWANIMGQSSLGTISMHNNYLDVNWL